MAEPILTADETEPISARLKRTRNNWNQKVATFFDRLAPEWDARMVIDEAKLNFILDAAGVKKEAVVLDVACGTGVLFPYYLRRSVAQVIGVDISAEMARIAAQKVDDPRVEVICGDIETIPVRRRCDCCVVYNAFPHFEDPLHLPVLSAGSRWAVDRCPRHEPGSATATPYRRGRPCFPGDALGRGVGSSTRPLVCGGYEDRGPGKIYCVGNM